MRPHRAHLHSHAVPDSILVVFWLNDLLALMLNCLCQLRLGGGGRGATARMLAHPSGSAFAESALRNAFAFLRRIYRFGGGFIETALPF